MEIFPIPAESYTLGFIGAGKMAESIARGAVRSGVLPPSRIRTAVHFNLARRGAFESFGVTVLPSNDDVFLFSLSLFFFLTETKTNATPFLLPFPSLSQVVRESDVVVLSVKPQLGFFFFAPLCSFMFDLCFHLRAVLLLQ